jgi:hypothetical protein
LNYINLNYINMNNWLINYTIKIIIVFFLFLNQVTAMEQIFEKIDWEWCCQCDICNNTSWCFSIKKHKRTWKNLCLTCVYQFNKKEIINDWYVWKTIVSKRDLRILWPKFSNIIKWWKYEIVEPPIWNKNWNSWVRIMWDWEKIEILFSEFNYN